MLIKLIKVCRWYTSLVLHSADLKMGLYDRSERSDKHFPLPIGIVVTNIRYGKMHNSSSDEENCIQGTSVQLSRYSKLWY